MCSVNLKDGGIESFIEWIKKEKIKAGIPIRTRGQHRKNSEPKNIIAEQAYEIQRLKMENDLLRDFLRFAERM